MNEVQEYRRPNTLGKIVSYLMIGTFGGAIIMLIVSSILLARTVSISREVRQNNEDTLIRFGDIQKQVKAENETIRKEVDASLTEARNNIDVFNDKLNETTNNMSKTEESRIEVVIDEDTVRKVVTEYLSEMQKGNPEMSDSSTSDLLDNMIERETETVLKMMELLVEDIGEDY